MWARELALRLATVSPVVRANILHMLHNHMVISFCRTLCASGRSIHAISKQLIWCRLSSLCAASAFFVCVCVLGCCCYSSVCLYVVVWCCCRRGVYVPNTRNYPIKRTVIIIIIACVNVNCARIPFTALRAKMHDGTHLFRKTAVTRYKYLYI